MPRRETTAAVLAEVRALAAALAASDTKLFKYERKELADIARTPDEVWLARRGELVEIRDALLSWPRARLGSKKRFIWETREIEALELAGRDEEHDEIITENTHFRIQLAKQLRTLDLASPPLLAYAELVGQLEYDAENNAGSSRELVKAFFIELRSFRAELGVTLFPPTAEDYLVGLNGFANDALPRLAGGGSVAR